MANYSVRDLMSTCINKSPPYSIRQDTLGVYATDNPQNRSLKDRLKLIDDKPFVRLATVVLQGTTSTGNQQRDMDNANIVYQNECDAWIYYQDNITVNRPDLLALDQDDCAGGGHSVSDEEDDLFDLGRTLGADVVGYYINSSNAGSFVGCAAHPPGRRGFWVGNGASPWTFAHELTHVVGDNSHVGNSDNLMSTPTSSITNPPPDLTNGQENRILNDGDMGMCGP
jgi:hypothetical protein